MSDSEDTPPNAAKAPRPAAAGDSRQDRLQQALRANLHRRKAQSRARSVDSRSGDHDATDD